MLELRPSCENCDKLLPPASVEAMICSFECTFCLSCVHNILHNVCPNCGGGFSARPIRPARNWKGENYLGKFPATLVKTQRMVNVKAHDEFIVDIKNISPEDR